MSNSVNALALAAKTDEPQREAFIQSYENLILKTASRASFRYVTKSDDEWSVALCAFSDAIDRYRPDQGSFLPFSLMLIKSPERRPPSDGNQHFAFCAGGD